MRLDYKQINPIMRFSDQVNSKANEDCTLFRCSVCKQQKPREQFFKNKSKSQGITAACKPCHQDIRRRLIKEGKMVDKKPVDYYERVQRGWHYKNKYGASKEQYEQIVISQDFRCKICNKHQSELNGRLHLDHDHNTSKVRGALCVSCNMHLGMLDRIKNKPEWSKSALKYLEESTCQAS